MLVEYYFKIKHVKGTDNARVDILSRKVKLQGNIKLSDTILRINKNRKIRYNHPKLIIVHEVLTSN